MLSFGKVWKIKDKSLHEINTSIVFHKDTFYRSLCLFSKINKFGHKGLGSLTAHIWNLLLKMIK